MSTNFTVSVPNWLDIIFAWPVMVYRWFKCGCAYRRIYLGDGEWTKLDTSDYYRYGNCKWGFMGNRGKIYAVRSTRIGKEKIKILPLHREIMRPRKGRVVDHENGDSLDNRRGNLRTATHAQNSYNCRKRKNATSKYIGVSFDKRMKYWEVEIKHKGKRIWIGRFKNEVEAGRAYDKVAKKFRGRFARLNFPQEKRNKHKNAGILGYLKIPFVSLGLCG